MRQAVFRFLAGLLGIGFIVVIVSGAANQMALHEQLMQCVMAAVFLAYCFLGHQPAERLLRFFFGGFESTPPDPQQPDGERQDSEEHADC